VDPNFIRDERSSFPSEASEGEMNTICDSYTLDSNSSYVDVGQVERSIVKYEYC